MHRIAMGIPQMGSLLPMVTSTVDITRMLSIIRRTQHQTTIKRRKATAIQPGSVTLKMAEVLMAIMGREVGRMALVTELVVDLSGAIRTMATEAMHRRRLCTTPLLTITTTWGI